MAKFRDLPSDLQNAHPILISWRMFCLSVRTGWKSQLYQKWIDLLETMLTAEDLKSTKVFLPYTCKGETHYNLLWERFLPGE